MIVTPSSQASPPLVPRPGFSLVEDPLLRLQRALRFAPHQGFGAPKRAVVLALFTWLPAMVWAVVTGHLQVGEGGEFALRHLGVHIRCLLAIPLFVLSEPIANRVIGLIADNFAVSGLVRSEDSSRFAAVIRSIERWRDAKVVWFVITGLVVVAALVARRSDVVDADALGWTPTPGALSFGGFWIQWIVRPVFLFLLLAWLWRLLLTGLLFRRIAGLDLHLVPSHPDRAGGLGFCEIQTLAFSLVVLAISSVYCSYAAHQILSHGAHFVQFKGTLSCLVVLLTVLFILPLTAFSRSLRRTLMRARFEYGTLAGRHVRGLDERWVKNRALEDPILNAPEIGPAADVATLYSLATQMRPVPIGRLTLVAVLLPALVPVLFVACTEVPLKEIVLKVLGALT